MGISTKANAEANRRVITVESTLRILNTPGYPWINLLS